jgi:hypothetical protein
MLIQLKSNGTKHTVTAEIWQKMSRDSKRNYNVLNETEEQVAKNTVENTAKSVPNTGDKKDFMPADELKALLKKKKITLTEEEFSIVNDSTEENKQARLNLEADLIAR